ncbi:MAG: hypothetical protein HZB65_04385 [Candidatus Aenigmarchaeota archaeon]|nr:hypothetical protein [Candidatus Aenigmarchaeota archaeon]
MAHYKQTEKQNSHDINSQQADGENNYLSSKDSHDINSCSDFQNSHDINSNLLRKSYDRFMNA